MIKDLKISIICGLILFVLIFIINIIIGNSLLIIFLRSLISCLAFSSIVFAIIYFFKNYINYKELLENDEKTDTSDDTSTVDILLDEDKKDISLNNNPAGTDTDDNDNDDTIQSNSDDALYDDEKIPETIELKHNAIEDIKIEDLDSLGSPDTSSIDDNIPKKNKSLNDDMIFPDNIEINNSNTTGIDQNENENSYSDENIESYKSYENDGKSLKDKIGVDVSFDEVAKAIRTKLRRDD